VTLQREPQKLNTLLILIKIFSIAIMNEENNIRSHHPERFSIDYTVEATTYEHAHEIAQEICLEQTVELPGSIQSVKKVEPFTVGIIEHVEFLHRSIGIRKGLGLWKVTIAYPIYTAGNELPQFLNLIFGNTSLKHGISVQDVTLSKSLMENRTMFPGPRFGLLGLRKLLGVPNSPLLCTALKPMGKSSEEFATMAYSFAKGGIDIIKVGYVQNC
jgi:ribulose-bisphosphate carboxylase large chain